jgi:hypothetical protein
MQSLALMRNYECDEEALFGFKRDGIKENGKNHANSKGLSHSCSERRKKTKRDLRFQKSTLRS